MDKPAHPAAPVAGRFRRAARLGAGCAGIVAVAFSLSGFSGMSSQEVAAIAVRASFQSALDEATVAEPPSAWAEAMSAIAATQARVGDLAAARATAATITVPAAKARAFAALALACTAGDMTEAKLLFGQAKAQAAAIPTESRDATLVFIALAQAKAHDMAGAAATLGTMSSLPERTSALLAIAAAQSRRGDIEGARATVRAIAEPAARTRALSAIAAARARAGDLASAKATVRTIPRLADKAEALGAIVAAQARNGDLTGATAAERIVPAGFPKVEALLGIAAAYGRMGDWAAARLFFGQAKLQAEPLADRRAEALAAIARAEFLAGDFDRAKATVASIPAGLLQGEMMSAVAAAHAWKLGLAEAATWVKTLRDPTARCHAHLGIARAAVARSRALASLEDDDE